MFYQLITRESTQNPMIFPHACRSAGIVPETDPEKRIAQAQELLREDPFLSDMLSPEGN